MAESQEKFRLCRSRTPGRRVDVQAQVRVLLSARDQRFERVREKRGWWKLRTTTIVTDANGSNSSIPVIYEEEERNYSMPARYKERSDKILRLMAWQERRNTGWAQKEIARQLDLDINAVSKVIGFMKTEGLIRVLSGRGKTQCPYMYTAVDSVLRDRVRPMR